MFFSMNKLFFSLIKENYKEDLFFIFYKESKFCFKENSKYYFNQSPSLIYFKIRLCIF